MLIYSSKWESDDTCAQWLVVDDENIFRRTRFRQTGTDGKRRHYSSSAWTKTEMTKDRLDERVTLKEVRKGRVEFSFKWGEK